MDWIAEARIELEMVRLLTLKTAWLMDTVGNKAAAVEISAIKVAAPNMALRIIDRAIQVHGAGGVSDDLPLARMYARQRALRFADGPDEVHKMTIARRELRRHDPTSAWTDRRRSRRAAAAADAGESLRRSTNHHAHNASTVTTLGDPARLVADRMTDWRFHCWYWGDAIAVDGLLEAHSLVGGSYRDTVVDTLQRWHDHCLANFDDVLAPGAAVIQLVIDGDLPATAAQRVLSQLDGLPMAHEEAPLLEPHRLVFRYGVCIDAVYHLPATYALAARWRDDADLARKAVRIAVESMDVLRCDSGWAQWFDPTRKRNNGVAWSRGLGWAVLGLLDLVEALDGRGTAEVADLAGQVLQRLAATQGPDGNWPEVLDHPPAGTETSTAAFYVAAALHPATKRPGCLAGRRAVTCHRGMRACGRRRRHLHRRHHRRVAQLGHHHVRELSHRTLTVGPGHRRAGIRRVGAPPSSLLQLDTELLEERQQVVGVLFLHGEDALHQTSGGDVLIGEPADDLAVRGDGHPFGHEVLGDHRDQVGPFDVLGMAALHQVSPGLKSGSPCSCTIRAAIWSACPCSSAACWRNSAATGRRVDPVGHVVVALVPQHTHQLGGQGLVEHFDHPFEVLVVVGERTTLDVSAGVLAEGLDVGEVFETHRVSSRESTSAWRIVYPPSRPTQTSR